MGLAGMLFALILVAMIGGFILLLPISRRLGALLEQKLAGKLDADDRSLGELRRLEATVRALQEEVERVGERQAFTESLLSERDPLLLRDRAGTGPGSSS